MKLLKINLLLSTAVLAIIPTAFRVNAEGAIMITEVNPLSEYFELYNGSNEELNVSGWQFSELTGSGLEKFWDFQDYTGTTKVGPQEYLVVYFSRKLNNSGDRLTIINDLNESVDQVVIPKAEKDLSYQLTQAGDFVWQSPSPGEANQTNSSSEEQDQNEEADNPNEEDGDNNNNNNEDEDGDGDEAEDEAEDPNSADNEGETSEDEAEDNTSENEADPETKSDEEADEEEGDISTKTCVADRETIELLTVEYFANSEGKESFEFYYSGSENLDLTSWQFSELTGSGVEKFWDFAKYTDQLALEAESTYELYFPSKLNDSGDTLRLYDQCQNLLDEFQYTANDKSSQKKLDSKNDEEKLKLVSKEAKLASEVTADHPAYELKIIEVSIRDRQSDYVKVLFSTPGCLSGCDLKGIRLASDTTDFEIPQGTVAKNNAQLFFHYGGSKPAEKIGKNWHFYLNKSGLTGTDETLFLLDSKEQVFDALCWANYNGEFSRGEKDDVYNLLTLGAIKSPEPLVSYYWFTEEVCFNSELINKDQILIRTAALDTNQKTDFDLANKNQKQKPHLADDSFKITVAELQFYPSGQGRVSFNSTVKPQKLVGLKLYLNEKEVSSFRQSEFFLEQLERQSGSLAIKDIYGAPVMEFTWNQPDGFYFPFSQIGTIYYDNENGRYAFRETAPVKMNQSPALYISEILPNPEGKDSGNELVELSTRSNVRLSRWRLYAGSQEVALPKQPLIKGDYFTLKVKGLTNTAGDLTLVSPEGDYYQLTWKNAKSGSSLAMINGEYQWTYQPTFGEDNILVSEKPPTTKKETSQEPKIIADNDLIPNTFEQQNGGSSENFDGINSEIYQLYSKSLQDSLELSTKIQDNRLLISGKFLPEHQVKFILNGEQIPATITKTGRLYAYGDLNLEAGNYNLVTLISNEQNLRIVNPQGYQFRLKQDLLAKPLKKAEIAGLMPNPQGKDSENELLIIANTSDQPGWLRGFELRSGKRKTSLEPIFIAANSQVEMRGNFKLVNKGGKAELINAQGLVVDDLSWGKSKDNDLWTVGGLIAGKEAKKSSTRSSKKRSSSEAKQKEAKITYVTGKIAAVDFPCISLKVSGEKPRRHYCFEEQADQGFFLRKEIIKPRNSVTLKIEEGEITRFSLAQDIQDLPRIVTTSGNNSAFLLTSFLLIFSGLGFCLIRGELVILNSSYQLVK
jgi:hypothetical protein